MPATLRKTSIETLVKELGQLSSASLRRKFLAKHKALVRLGTVEDLAQLVVQKVRVSTQEALNLAEAAVLIAKRLRRKEALALGCARRPTLSIPPAIIAPPSNTIISLSSFTNLLASGWKPGAH